VLQGQQDHQALPECGVVKESRESEATEDFLVNRDYVVLLECMENRALLGRQHHLGLMAGTVFLENLDWMEFLAGTG
jgi:hypothetical protein